LAKSSCENEKIEWEKKKTLVCSLFMLEIINGVVVSNRYKLTLENMFAKQE
jgi:hypothetical protein